MYIHNTSIIQWWKEYTAEQLINIKYNIPNTLFAELLKPIINIHPTWRDGNAPHVSLLSPYRWWNIFILKT
jgi:hypothetical protein